MQIPHHFSAIGDPEADAIISELEAATSAERIVLLQRQLGRWEPPDAQDGGGQSGPAASEPPLEPLILDYLSRPYAVPTWADAGRIRAIQAHYQSLRQVVMVALGTYSLPAVYLSPNISLTLMGTGQLMQHTRRRLMETQRFVEIVTSPGALVDPGTSWAWLRKVRLTHAVARRNANRVGARAGLRGAALRPAVADAFTVRHEDRNATAPYEVALDQLELAFVQLTFTCGIGDGLAALGHPFDDRQRRDHIHLWALAGHMLGIDDALLPGGPLLEERQATPLFNALVEGFVEQGNPIGRVIRGAFEARLLTAALVAVLVEIQRQALPGWAVPWARRLPFLDEAVKCLPRLLIRRNLGARAANVLNIGRPPLLYTLVASLGLSLIDLRTWADNIPADLKKQWLSP